MPRHFAWQAWHLATSTFVSRGRRGTWRHLPSFCVAGVALMGLVAWQLWHLATSTFVSRGTCGTWRHPLSFRVAGVALADVAGDAVALCVAGVALGDVHLRFAWQAWHLVKSTFEKDTVVFPRPRLSQCVPAHGPESGSTDPSSGVNRRFIPWGSWFWLCTSAHLLLLLHTIFHTQLCPHTIFHHTIFSTQLCHTPSFATPCFTHRFVHTPSFTHSFVTHTHTIFLCHTPSFTHNFVTHTVFLCHGPSFTYRFVTHNSSHTSCFYFSILHHILCLSCLPRPPLQHLWIIIGRS